MLDINLPLVSSSSIGNPCYQHRYWKIFQSNKLHLIWVQLLFIVPSLSVRWWFLFSEHAFKKKLSTQFKVLKLIFAQSNNSKVNPQVENICIYAQTLFWPNFGENVLFMMSLYVPRLTRLYRRQITAAQLNFKFSHFLAFFFSNKNDTFRDFEVNIPTIKCINWKNLIRIGQCSHRRISKFYNWKIYDILV